MIKTNKQQQGFTLIELLLAMAFLTFMLLFVVTALTQLIGSYNKGLVYKGINQAGRTVLEEISRSIRSGTAKSTVVATDQGRLCTGGKAYIWNTDSILSNKYENEDTNPVTGIIRLEDLTNSYCTTTAKQPKRAEATVLVDSNVKVRSLSIARPYDGKLSLFDMQLSTSGTDDFETALSPEGDYICKGGKAGEFCAVVRIKTAVSIRNLGG